MYIRAPHRAELALDFAYGQIPLPVFHSPRRQELICDGWMEEEVRFDGGGGGEGGQVGWRRSGWWEWLVAKRA